MIRRFNINDTDSVMRLWLETNIKAHSFIDKNYWYDNYKAVKALLNDAETFIYIYEHNHLIQGFAGLIGNYIAGIFVGSGNQSKGVGKMLLDCIKETKSELSLNVYKKNSRAVTFYLREDFSVLKEQLDKNTGETEIVMNWINRK